MSRWKRAATFAAGALCAIAALCACGQQRRTEPAPVDPSSAPEYSQAVQQLHALNSEAEGMLKSGKPDAAASAITRGLPLQTKLLEAPRPPIGAMVAISDLDDLYARMLLLNHRDGWARVMYQKNVARWKWWRPQTDESQRRLRQAEAGIAECDRRLK